MMIFLFSCPARAQSGSIVISDPIGLDMALSKDDQEQLKQIINSGKLNKTMISLTEAMRSLNLPKTVQLASQCRESASSAGASAAAIRCNMILAGAWKSIGNAKEWSYAMKWYFDVGFPAILKKAPAGATISVGSGYDEVNFKQVYEKSPQLTVTKLASSGSVPITRKIVGGKGGWVPMVPVVINGHRLNALIDTGAEATILIDPSLATKLGLEKIVSGISDVKQQFTEVHKRASPSDAIFIVKDLEFGPLRLENYMIIGSPRVASQNIGGVVLGEHLLQQFSSVSFKRDKLYFSFEPAPVCAYPVNYRFAVRPNMNGLMIFDGSADGTPIKLSLDTGISEYVLGTSSYAALLGNRSSHKSEELAVISGGVFEKFVAIKYPIRVSFGGIEVSQPNGIVLKNVTTVPSVFLGSRVLDDYSIVIDLNENIMCFDSMHGS